MLAVFLTLGRLRSLGKISKLLFPRSACLSTINQVYFYVIYFSDTFIFRLTLSYRDRTLPQTRCQARRTRVVGFSHTVCASGCRGSAYATSGSRRYHRTHCIRDHATTLTDGEDRTRETWGAWWRCACELCRTRSRWREQALGSYHSSWGVLLGYHPLSRVRWGRPCEQYNLEDE